MSAAILDLIVGRPRDLGGFSVARVLPIGHRKTVGPFIFFDHFGPTVLAAGRGMDVRPHPHIGLATVTYVPGSVTIGVPGVLGVACNVGGVTQSDASVFNSTTKTVTATIPTVGGGTSTAVAFQVKIN